MGPHFTAHFRQALLRAQKAARITQAGLTAVIRCKNMKAILVPTGFSQCANNAMKYALDLAQQIGTLITVLYIVYPSGEIDKNRYKS